MSLVILDTNSVARDFRLRTPAMRFLLRRSNDGLDRVVLPSVALRESIAVYKRQYRDQIGKIEHAFKSLERLRSDLEDYEPLWEEDLGEVDDYGQWLEQILGGNGIEIRDPPEATLELVDRAANRVPPFDAKGQNFRDVLIWLTIMDVLRHDEPTGVVSFVSADRSAFWKDNNLHPNLIQEFDGLNLPGVQLLLFRSILDFVRSQITDEVEVHLQISELIDEELPQLLTNLDYLLSDQRLDIPGAYGDGVVRGVAHGAEPHLIVDHVGSIEGQAEFLVSMTLETDLTVEVDGFDTHFDTYLTGDWQITRSIPVTGIWLPNQQALDNLTIGPIEALASAGGYIT